ncbi:hypothetical protein P7K49_010113 [Saguinus oedipus]|uniref:Uncharacterized protein n=1 Tax=Saguinus oedipus TaxID=9490 RepID=A0ABQ9VMD3_SAGOE|nr:hypothetical protein P7K49_010113 [Saguinus oedipus]
MKQDHSGAADIGTGRGLEPIPLGLYPTLRVRRPAERLWRMLWEALRRPLPTSGANSAAHRPVHEPASGHDFPGRGRPPGAPSMVCVPSCRAVPPASPGLTTPSLQRLSTVTLALALAWQTVLVPSLSGTRQACHPRGHTPSLPHRCEPPNPYYAECHGVIYVIDSTDEERLAESKQAFEKVVTSEALCGVPVLVLANKQDVEVSPTPPPAAASQVPMLLWVQVPSPAARGTVCAPGHPSPSDCPAGTELF